MHIAHAIRIKLRSKCEVCCSVLQCVAVCCSVLQYVTVCCSILQREVACCIVLQYRSSGVHSPLAIRIKLRSTCEVCCSVVKCVAVCCSSFQCVALCWSMLEYAAVCCSVLQYRSSGVHSALAICIKLRSPRLNIQIRHILVVHQP